MRLNLQLFATIEEIAKEVIRGNWGNGADRKNRLTAAGYNYSDVQAAVNSMLGASSTTKKTTTTTAPTTTAPATSTAAPTATPKDFKYEDYEKSDITKQAEALLQQQMANKPGEYQSNWQSQLNETLDKILNREEFSYDLNGDALYQQYKDQYMLQGKQAMMDTMGQAQAATGGYGNSYAQTVGQQVYQGHLQQLNDKVPELYKLALDQYNQEGQDLYNQYGLYADMDEREYGRYRDKVSDYNTELARLIDEARYQDETGYNRYSADKTFDYGQFIDSIEYDYKVNRDAIADAETKKKYAYDTAMGMLNLGVTPSAQMLADAGISSSDANAIVKKVKTNEAAAAAAKTPTATPTPTPTPTPDPTPAPKKSEFEGWKATDWNSYFAQIRQTEGKAAAEKELEELTRNGIIPKEFLSSASIGARGSLGH